MPRGKYPQIYMDLTNEDVQALADSADSEEVALGALGIKPYQIESIKKTQRFQHNWRIGKARFAKRYNEGLAKSEETVIQKMIAEHTLPPKPEFDEDVVVEVDAPEWWLKKKKINKSVKVAKTKHK